MIVIRKSHLLFASAVAVLLVATLIQVSSSRTANAGTICSDQNVVAGLLEKCDPVLETMIAKESVEVEPGGAARVTVDCPPDTLVTGGGFSGHPQVEVVDSRPFDSNTWSVEAVNEGTLLRTLRAYAVCLAVR